MDEKPKTSEANFVDGTDIFSRNTLNRPRDFSVHAGCACVQSAVQGEYALDLGKMYWTIYCAVGICINQYITHREHVSSDHVIRC